MFGNRHEETSKVHPIGRGGDPHASPDTFIDQGCELIGELRFEGAVRIDGQVEGTIRAAQGVIIGEAAQIEASVHAEEVEIFGTVDGDLHVAHATLHATARVHGEIVTAGIVVEEGAQFSGTIRIGRQQAKEAEPPTTPGEGERTPSEVDAIPPGDEKAA